MQLKYSGKVVYYGVITLLLFSMFTGFVERYIEAFDTVTLLVFFSISFFLFLFSPRKKNLIVFYKPPVFILVLVIASSFLYACIMGLVQNYILEFVIIFSFIFVFFCLKELSHSQAKNILLLIILICAFQLIVDAFLPNSEKSALDMYSGTFIMANNKSRFLLLIFVFVTFYYKVEIFKQKFLNHLFKLIIIISILISFVAGSSQFAIIFSLMAILAAMFIKRLWIFLTINIVGLYSVFVLFMKGYESVNINDRSAMLFIYHRYFDDEHGVYAVYSYGFEQMGILGTGLGNFITRAGQLFESDIAINVPRTMITFGHIYQGAIAPPGVSALFVVIVEMGIFAIPLLYLFLNKLWKVKCNYLWGVFSFYYFFYMINYTAAFFEFSECFLYLTTFYVTNKYVESRKQEKLKLAES